MGVGQRFLVGSVGIADSNGAVGQPLLQTAVGVPDCLGLLGGGLAVFRLHRDNRRADADFHINAPDAGVRNLLPGVQALLAQQAGQPDIQGMFVFAGRH